MMRPNSESGVIAIFLSVLIGILLLTTTTFAARLSVSELDQASQVDRSEQAYYAAEAGVEEAVQRIDAASADASIQQIFPEQFTSATTQPGDKLKLTGDDGSGFPDAKPATEVTATTAADEYGKLSWRNRKVYQQSTYFSGTQVKDESVQFDTTDLRRRCPSHPDDTNGGPATNYLDQCRGNASIFAAYQGIRYCWTPNTAIMPQIELTDVSYPSSNINAIETHKSILNPNDSVVLPYGSQIRVVIGDAAGENCLTFTIGQPLDRRYLFRIKPIYGTVGAAQGPHSVRFRANLVESPKAAPTSEGLFIPNGSYYIDVVGQSGDIKRRVIAKKERSGRLLGIFDYVLYSGSTTQGLCKGGVNQTDSGIFYDNCATGGTGNQTGYSYPTPSYANPYSTPYANPYASPYLNPYASPYVSPYASPYTAPYDVPYYFPYYFPYYVPYFMPYFYPYDSPYSAPYYVPCGGKGC